MSMHIQSFDKYFSAEWNFAASKERNFLHMTDLLRNTWDAKTIQTHMLQRNATSKKRTPPVPQAGRQ